MNEPQSIKWNEVLPGTRLRWAAGHKPSEGVHDCLELGKCFSSVFIGYSPRDTYRDGKYEQVYVIRVADIDGTAFGLGESLWNAAIVPAERLSQEEMLCHPNAEIRAAGLHYREHE